MTDCRISREADQYAVLTYSNLKIDERDALQREVDAWKALGNKPSEVINSDEVRARGRKKRDVVKEAKKRNKSTFFFGCALHGETRFSTETKKCIACTKAIVSRVMNEPNNIVRSALSKYESASCEKE